MNPDLLRLMIAGAFGVHGIGHSLGWMPAWGLASFQGMSSRSWLLTGLLGERITGLIGGALWFAPMAGFGIAAIALLTGNAMWRPVAVGSAAVSLVAVALFWDALPVSSRIGCIAVDLAVLGGTLVANWPSAEVLSS